MKSVVAFTLVSAMTLGITGGPTLESITLGTTKNPAEIESLLNKTKQSLGQKDADDDYFWFRNAAERCIEDLDVPAEFKGMSDKLEANFKQKHYGKCADIATKMQAMIPRELPNSYPYKMDYHAEWRSRIGDLRAMGNDYRGALNDYTIALREPGPYLLDRDGNPTWRRQLRGHKSAAYGRAEMYALLGKRDEALADLKSAPSYYWSGCGNCQEGSQHSQDRLQTVFSAATQPGPEAEVELLRLVAGGYQPLMGFLTLASMGDEKNWARRDATFYLGELYLRQGKMHLAKLAFEALAGSDSLNYGRRAESRLEGLKND